VLLSFREYRLGRFSPAFFLRKACQPHFLSAILRRLVELPGRIMDGLNYDLHIHTAYCGHAEEMSIEAILNAADDIGLDTICIADHIYSPNEISIPAQIKKEVSAYKTKCRVLIGAEIDVAGGFSDGRLACPVPDGLDYCLAGIHYIPGPGNFPRHASDNSIAPDELLHRWRTTLLGVFENPAVDALAHPGRMMAAALDLNEHFEAILDVLRDVAPTAAKKNILWEINEHDKDKIPATFQNEWHRVYEIALDADVRLIYGSDSHFPREIGGTEFTQRILSKLPAGCLQTPQTLRL
jgi:HisJ family histidinol phosphate phosphatase